MSILNRKILGRNSRKFLRNAQARANFMVAVSAIAKR